LSGLKISVQEINRIQREQLQLKAQRKAREKARQRELQIGIECGQEILKLYLEELEQLLSDIERFTINNFEREHLIKQLKQLKENARELLDFLVFEDDEKGLEDYERSIKKYNSEIRGKLKVCYNAIGRWERKQEKADLKSAKLQMIEAQEKKKLLHKQEMLKIEEQNDYQNSLLEYEKEYIHEAIEDAMEEIGYEIVGIKENEGSTKQEEIFEYQEGVAIHVIEQNCQITMEVVATDTISRKASESEQELIEKKMFEFEVQYAQIQDILRKKGISPKGGSEMILPPSKAMVKVENLSQYDTNLITVEETSNGAVATSDVKKKKKKTRRRAMEKKYGKTY